MSQSTSNYMGISKTLSNLKILKVLGITCFSVENGKSVTKFEDVLCIVSSILIGILACYYAVIVRVDLTEQQSKIYKIGNFLVFIASVVIIILSMFITFIFRHRIWSLAQKLDDIEQKVRI